MYAIRSYYENRSPGDGGHGLVVHPSVELRQPVVHGGEESHAGAAEHGEVEVADHEIGVMHMHVGGRRAEYQAGQPADGEEENEGECEESYNFV